MVSVRRIPKTLKTSKSYGGHQQGFAHVVLLFALVFIGVCAFIGWRYYEAGKPPVKPAVIRNFDECRIAEGSSIVQSYPEQCVSQAGDIYVNESQKVPNPADLTPEPPTKPGDR